MVEKNSVVSCSAKTLFLIAIVFLFCGANACQEHYYFANQVSLAPTATPTADDNEDNSDEDVTETPTATVSSTATEKESPSPSATKTPIIDDSEDEGIDETVNEFLLPLAEVPSENSNINSLTTQKVVTEKKLTENWLGKLYSKDSGGTVLDSDNDGFCDKLELDFGTDVFNASSYPDIPLVTSLAARFQGKDSDLDGVLDKEEILLGLNPQLADTDSDGVNDGAELLSGSNPLDAKNTPIDADGDGLDDSFEIEKGYNWKSKDTDNDGLRDDVELALGTSIFDNDSDYDGILDGKEVELGTDPLMSENIEK